MRHRGDAYVGDEQRPGIPAFLGRFEHSPAILSPETPSFGTNIVKNRKCPRLGLIWGHSRTKLRELCCRAAMGPDESAPSTLRVYIVDGVQCRWGGAPSMSRPGIVDGVYGLPPCDPKRKPGPIRNLPPRPNKKSRPLDHSRDRARINN